VDKNLYVVSGWAVGGDGGTSPFMFLLGRDGRIDTDKDFINLTRLVTDQLQVKKIVIFNIMRFDRTLADAEVLCYKAEEIANKRM